MADEAVLKGILGELHSMNARLKRVEENTLNTQTAVSEYFNSIENRDDQRAQEIQRLRERVSSLEGSLR